MLFLYYPCVQARGWWVRSSPARQGLCSPVLLPSYSCVIPVLLLCYPHVTPVLLLYYPLTGPWLVGEIITGQTGVVFAWGTFVGGAFIPGLLQYAFGTLQMLLFHLPVMLATGAVLHCR